MSQQTLDALYAAANGRHLTVGGPDPNGVYVVLTSSDRKLLVLPDGDVLEDKHRHPREEVLQWAHL